MIWLLGLGAIAAWCVFWLGYGTGRAHERANTPPPPAAPQGLAHLSYAPGDHNGIAAVPVIYPQRPQDREYIERWMRSVGANARTAAAPAGPPADLQ